MTIRIVAVSAEPGLAAMVAQWRLDTFPQATRGYTLERLTALISTPPPGPAETFVLFDGDQPAATAGLAGTDLESRPDLTPWLAGVIVLPAFRGRGHAAALVRRVEATAWKAGAPVLWLYTTRAEGLYLRLGWESVGMEQDAGRPVVLMRRHLARPATAGTAQPDPA